MMQKVALNGDVLMEGSFAEQTTTFMNSPPMSDLVERSGQDVPEIFQVSKLASGQSLINKASDSSTVCTLTDSGLECRVCGTSDGRTSASTLGVMLCMLIIVGLSAIKKRRVRAMAAKQNQMRSGLGINSHNCVVTDIEAER